jgi:hypothetical protein
MKSKREPQKPPITWHQWLTHIILAMWKAEIGRIVVGGQPGQIVDKIPFLN